MRGCSTIKSRYAERKYPLSWWIKRYGIHRTDRGSAKYQRPYQEKVAAGNNERWSLIDSAIDESFSTCLDIGCNLGDVTVSCASRGLWTVGLDRSPDLIDAARRKHGKQVGCAFGVLDITQASVQKLPQFDVVLLLNVHHNWHRAFGDLGGREILRQFGRRSKLILFQGPSRRRRFGAEPPDFVDNDEVSIVAYYNSFLMTTFEGIAQSVELLGKSSVVGTREPYRWLYAVRMT